MKKNLSNILLICMFFVGLSVMLYPPISSYWNSRVQSRAIVDYESVLQQMSQEDYSAIFEKADEYNEELKKINFPLKNYDQIEGYNDILNVSGTGIIGYIDIEKIKVELPIYHGTSKSVLDKAAGHLEGTSFPIGGDGTHAALSAHRGLPSARLFTDLDKMEVGDIFTITILDRLLTYEVDQILIVEPSEIEALDMEEGKDYCTLITCTPYGINTHRLLVRGTRISSVKPKSHLFVQNEVDLIDPIIVAPIVAMPMLFVLLIVLLIKYRKKK